MLSSFLNFTIKVEITLEIIVNKTSSLLLDIVNPHRAEASRENNNFTGIFSNLIDELKLGFYVNA